MSRFVQESFAPVYPDRGSEWIDETVPIEPVDYNMSVADAERSALRFAASGGMATIMRFGAFYGLAVRPPKLLPPFVTPLFGSAGSLLSRSQRISNRKLRDMGWNLQYRTIHEGFPATFGAHAERDAHPLVHASRAG